MTQQLIQRTIVLTSEQIALIELSQAHILGDGPIEQFIREGLRLMLNEWGEWESNCSTCRALFDWWNYEPRTFPPSAIVYVLGFTPDSECLILHPHSHRQFEFERDPQKWIKTYSLQEIHDQLSPYLEDEMEELCGKWLAIAESALGVVA
jgi:hypothetical protein